MVILLLLWRCILLLLWRYILLLLWRYIPLLLWRYMLLLLWRYMLLLLWRYILLLLMSGNLLQESFRCYLPPIAIRLGPLHSSAALFLKRNCMRHCLLQVLEHRILFTSVSELSEAAVRP